jgi:hypothetical protein
MRPAAANADNSAYVKPTTSPTQVEASFPPEFWLALGGVVGLLDGLTDAATRAGVVPVLSGPVADLLSLFATRRRRPPLVPDGWPEGAGP